MTLDDLYSKIKPEGNKPTPYWIIGLVGEAGELANVFKKMWRDGNDLTEQIADELADVFISTVIIAKHLNMDLSQIVHKKLKELERRNSRKDR